MAPRPEWESAGRGSGAARDEGLRRIRRLSVGIGAGALGGLGLLTGVTAHVGSPASANQSSSTDDTATTAVIQPAAGSSTPSVNSSNTGSTYGDDNLSSPAQLPSSSTSRSGATSGGS